MSRAHELGATHTDLGREAASTMINFPIFHHLTVSGYGLFPGPASDSQDLSIDFHPGLTLVVGANGLGKTTLVNILYRLLTGPFDIPGLSSRPGLGSQRLVTTALSSYHRRAFARRVSDDARDAKARLDFALGDHEITVERQLNNLSLVSFTIDGHRHTTNDRQDFQREIPRLSGLWSFGDWVLMLRHLVFYFEDRRALVWDPSAQRQILRFLFLPVATARQWAEDERAILELDSRMRNLNSAVTREERALAENEFKLEEGVNILKELKILEERQGIDDEQRDLLEGEVPEIEAARESSRLRLLRAEQEYENRFRELERSKLVAISARFPSSTETARYIFSHLMTKDTCLVCGQSAPTTAREYGSRIHQAKCVVCGTDLAESDEFVPAGSVADRRVERAHVDLERMEKEIQEAQDVMDEAQRRHNAHVISIQTLNQNMAQRSARIDSLVRRLPPEEAEVHQQRSELASMRARVQQMRKDLLEKRQAFGAFVEEVSRELASRAEQIQSIFNTYAEDFLLEICSLVWAPQKARIGETGDLIIFPAFELEMSGSDFVTPVRRAGPEQVSESQRDFIDLAFRMALMAVAGASKRGSIVIDAPESSLDSVFVTRAANVLDRFSAPDLGNRLVVTSNLVEGGLIPNLLSRVPGIADREKRIVDLLEVAFPTAAVRELRAEYDRVRDLLLFGGSELEQ